MLYFLSDAHIGSRAIGYPASEQSGVGVDDSQHQLRFVHMLNTLAQDATAFYLLGDIFDFWSEYFWRDPSKQEFAPLLDCLKAITDKGIPVHYFIGNHDIWTYGWLARRTGVTIHRHGETLTIAGKRCMIAHGDGLVPTDYIRQFPKDIQRKIRSFMRLRAIFHNPVAQFFFRLVPPAWGNKFGYSWAKSSRLKELANPCPYKGENREELVLYAKEHELYNTQSSTAVRLNNTQLSTAVRLNNTQSTTAVRLTNTQPIDFYIFGHRHIELDLQLASGARVIILGDCFRQWTYAAMTEQGELQLLNFYEQ